MTTPRSRVMAVLTVLAVLGVGVAGGIAIDRTLLARHMPARTARGGGGPFGIMTEPVDTAVRNRMRTRIVKRISDDLSLTTQQSAAVSGIFMHRELQLDSLRAHVGPQLDSLRLQMRASMDSVLTPAQRVRFAESRRKMEARWRAGNHGGAHGGERRSGDSTQRE